MAPELNKRQRKQIIHTAARRIEQALKLLREIEDPDLDPRVVEKAMGLLKSAIGDHYSGKVGLDTLVEHYFS